MVLPAWRWARAWALRSALAVLGVLLASTALVYALEQVLALGNASSVYLLAVAAVAIGWGTVAAVGTALGAFLIYNFLFVEPRYSFDVARGEELLTLLLLLFVGVIIGRLAGRQRDRQREAGRREREAQALFRMSRTLATAGRLSDAVGSVVERIVADAGMSRCWVGLGSTTAQERVLADSSPTTPLPAVVTHSVLRREREGRGAKWTRVHLAAPPSSHAPPSAGTSARTALYRVEIRAGDDVVGSVWTQRPASAGEPHLEETRLLAATADQLGQAVRRDHLAAQAAELEIARRSDELKTALLDSVSHDLRTPLATIRAAAGSLADPHIELPPAERRATAQAIDDEAERLNRLVGKLLDMSLIQAGELVADIDVIPLEEVIEPVMDRMRPMLVGRDVTIELPTDLPSVRADATFLDQVIANLLENAAKHASPGAAVRVTARASGEPASVSIRVEDGGAGVPDELLLHLFDRFSRGPQTKSGDRRGFGLGLAVVRGLVEAMAGDVVAGRGSMGGLAVTVTLPAAPAADDGSVPG